MASMQMFPETVEQFMEAYKMFDAKSGTECVPTFWMKQWFEHEKTKRGSVDDLYFLLDTDGHVLDAMYLTRDQATAIEHALDIVEHCGNEFTLVSAVEGGNIPDFRPKKGES